MLHKNITMKKGDTVHWQWGAHETESKIIEKHTGTTTKIIKAESGAPVLKSESELKKR